MSDTACSFCGLPLFLTGSAEHPCCSQARDRGESSCVGCDGFKKRWRKAKTCPHVIGMVKACCVLRDGGTEERTAA